MHELLEQTLKRTGLPVRHYEYVGTAEEYIVYNEEVEKPVNYADNVPQNIVTWWQVHLFAPKRSEFRAHKDVIKAYLLEAGFVVTDVTTLYEEETKEIHVVLCCHIGERME